MPRFRRHPASLAIAAGLAVASLSCRSVPPARLGSAPREVGAAALAYDRVLVSWAAPAGGDPSEYVIYRNGEKVARTRNRMFLDAGLATANSVPYAYEIAGVWGRSEGERSARVEASRDCPREHIPTPILAEHPEWVEVYWKAWQIAWSRIQAPGPKSGFVSSYMDEAFNPHIFQWDTCFMVLFGRYAGGVFPGIHSLDNFYAKQHPDGFICREIVEEDGSDSFAPESDQSINPPLFAWVEWESYRFTGDRDRLEAVLPRLVSYYRWIQEHRRRANGFYWTSALGSGMDNSPRSGHGWVDLTAQQALAAISIARIAEVVGDGTIAETFRYEHRLLKDLVNERAWDPEDQIYYDLAEDGSRLKVKTAAAFWPLLAHIPSLSQAAGLIYHLNNPKEFRRPHLFPSLSADHPAYDPKGGYWLGAVWPPTWFAIVKGLESYGIDDLAFEATASHLSHVAAVFKDTGTIYENYAPERAEPGDPARGDFVGWSGLGPIVGLIENILGFGVSAPRGLVQWRIRLTEAHGIRHLRFGEHDVSLFCEQRAAPDAPCHLTIETTLPFALVHDPGFGPQLIEIPAGGARFTVRNPALPGSD